VFTLAEFSSEEELQKSGTLKTFFEKVVYMPLWLLNKELHQFDVETTTVHIRTRIL
jgi:hypothetical protein